jgi:pyruvate,water dikinase
MRSLIGPLDIEWVIDDDNKLWFTQARPIFFPKAKLPVVASGQALLTGAGIGASQSVAGQVWKLSSPKERDRSMRGGILVVDDTSPVWEECLPHFSALVTDHGCRTSHAAIIARETGIPAVVGTVKATELLTNGTRIVVRVENGHGYVHLN